MQNEMGAVAAEPAARVATGLERLLVRDIGGVPVVLIACGLLAVVFGGLVAMTAGGQ